MNQRCYTSPYNIDFQILYIVLQKFALSGMSRNMGGVYKTFPLWSVGHPWNESHLLIASDDHPYKDTLPLWDFQVNPNNDLDN